MKSRRTPGYVFWNRWGSNKILLKSCTKLLATDMDGTIIPHAMTPDQQRALNILNNTFANSSSTALAYITGRHFELTLEGICENNLPAPDVIVCDVGTSIYWRNGDKWQPDTKYATLLDNSLGDHSMETIEENICNNFSLQLQEKQCQGTFKRSYYIPAKATHIPLNLENFFKEKGITATIIFSVDIHKCIGLLDIIPANSGKYFALDYLMDAFAILPKNMAYAGDSGNDLQAFSNGYQAIVLANTDEQTKKTLSEEIEKGNVRRHDIYFTKKQCTAGVLEGCRYFGILS